MVFNTIVNNISVISLLSVLLVKETRENHQPQVTDKLDHIMLYGFSISALMWGLLDVFIIEFCFS